MSQHKTLEAAARAYGAANGVTGKAGGWLYRNGAPLCQGWRSYGQKLVNSHLIYVLDKDGCRIDREKTANGVVTRGWAVLRREAASFVVPEPEDTRSVLQRLQPQVTVRDQASWSKNSVRTLSGAMEGLYLLAIRAIADEDPEVTVTEQLVALDQAKRCMDTIEARLAVIRKALKQ